jgi:ribonuclease VapC
MIVDTSAIMSVLMGEDDSADFIKALAIASRRQISAGNWIELSAVLTRRKSEALDAAFDSFRRTTILEIEPVSVDQAQIGHDAYRKYGHGSGHKADLNFGDCFAYALAKASGEPLLYKGEDFSRTDIIPAIPLQA